MAKKTEEREIIIGVTKMKEPTSRSANEKNNKKVKSKNKKKKNQQKNNKKAQNKHNTSKRKVPQKVVSQEEQEKIRKKRKRIIFVLKYGALSILFITIILCAMFSPLFNIKTIQVQGNEKVTENEIISLSQIQIEQNTFQISKNRIKKQIKQNAYIGKVKISRKLPSTLIIQVEERKPVYLLEYAGAYVYVDKYGYLLEIGQAKLELPILQGEITGVSEFSVGNRLCTEDLETLSSVDQIMEVAKINELSNLITRIDISQPKNIKLIFETEEKTAYLGDNSNLNTKILTIKSILEKEQGKAGEIFVNIDLNKENAVFRERV